MAWFQKYNLKEEELKTLQEVEKEAFAIEKDDQAKMEMLRQDIENLELLRRRTHEIEEFIRVADDKANKDQIAQKIKTINNTLIYLEKAVAKLLDNEKKEMNPNDATLTKHILYLLNKSKEIIEEHKKGKDDWLDEDDRIKPY